MSVIGLVASLLVSAVLVTVRGWLVALPPFSAGLRLGETPSPFDLADAQLPARKGLIAVRDGRRPPG